MVLLCFIIKCYDALEIYVCIFTPFQKSYKSKLFVANSNMIRITFYCHTIPNLLMTRRDFLRYSVSYDISKAVNQAPGIYGQLTITYSRPIMGYISYR